MIDWHTHILPEMDDGSHCVAESISMVNMQAAQGVSTIIATPHFYANHDTVSSFLDRREKTYGMLKAELPREAPDIKLGAEVLYYQGISRLEGLMALRIEGSKLLLLEMPMTEWTEHMIKELIELSGKGGIRLVLAHVERYFGMQKQAVWERLSDSGILMQVNASFFTSFTSKRKAFSLLREGKIHFVGSDCHNMTSRPPQIGRAFEIIRKKLGDGYLAQMNRYGYSLLGE